MRECIIHELQYWGRMKLLLFLTLSDSTLKQKAKSKKPPDLFSFQDPWGNYLAWYPCEWSFWNEHILFWKSAKTQSLLDQFSVTACRMKSISRNYMVPKIRDLLAFSVLILILNCFLAVLHTQKLPENVLTECTIQQVGDCIESSKKMASITELKRGYMNLIVILTSLF